MANTENVKFNDSVEYKVYVTNTPVTCSNFVYTVKLS